MTLVLRVADKPGVLNRIASLFRRRRFNIKSLSVGPTGEPGTSRMTIVVETDESGPLRLEANLYKLVDVIEVENLTSSLSVVRELAMIRVDTSHETRGDLMQLVSEFGARVLYRGQRSITLEASGTEDKIDGLIESLRGYRILEVARTGRAAILAARDETEAVFFGDTDSSEDESGKFRC